MEKPWDAEGYDNGFRFVTSGGEPLLALLAPRPGERILDLGCGTGELTARIAAAGAEVIGLDADAAMITRARARFPHLGFQQDDAEAAAFPRPLDAVFSNAALHWMRRPAEVIARVAASLRPGGRFVAEMGGHGNVATIVQVLTEARAAAGLPPLASPWFFPSVAQYAALLESGGLEPRAMWLFDRPTPLNEGGLVAWIEMFGTPYLADLPTPAAARALAEAAAARAPILCREGTWLADYRRLRFVAVRA